MYAGQMMMLSIGIGLLISVLSSVYIIIKARREGSGWDEMKTPLYYAQSPLAICLVLAGVAKAILPPKNLSIEGQINASFTDTAAINKGHHCFVEINGELRHPGIEKKIEKFKTRFTTRDRFELTGYGMSPVSHSGVSKGFHRYSVNYNHMHYKSGEKIPTPRRSTRTYWVDHKTCRAELRGDSNYGFFDPLSFINFNDWFNN